MHLQVDAGTVAGTDPIGGQRVLRMPWSRLDGRELSRRATPAPGRWAFALLFIGAAALLAPKRVDAQQESGKVGSVAPEPSTPSARRPQSIPASSIIVVIRRAYVFGSGSDRFCSPEVTVYNQASKGVGILMVAAEYFQTRNGSTRRVGSTHSRFTVDPNENVSVGFNRLSTDSCDGIVAKASVSVCLWRDRSGCEDRVVFSDSGQLPMLDLRNQ